MMHYMVFMSYHILSYYIISDVTRLYSSYLLVGEPRQHLPPDLLQPASRAGVGVRPDPRGLILLSSLLYHYY